ncbi:hypothetical protein D3Z51_08660 [Clostridiaceae bacterium]|nr:hypothetical protein [Clostridiaceae bacterium]RKI14341.1 hypothetical protein D7V81_08145 [bacterium 1XD21-70]
MRTRHLHPAWRQGFVKAARVPRRLPRQAGSISGQAFRGTAAAVLTGWLWHGLGQGERKDERN